MVERDDEVVDLNPGTGTPEGEERYEGWGRTRERANVWAVLGWVFLTGFGGISILRWLVWDASWIDVAIDFGLVACFVVALQVRRMVGR